MAEPDPLDTLKTQTEPLRASLHDLTGLADGFGRAMASAFKGAVAEGKDLDDVLRSLALSLSGNALSAALAPIGRGLGDVFSGLLGGLGAAKAGASGSGIAPLTREGVIAAPGYFPVLDAVGTGPGAASGSPPGYTAGERFSGEAAGGVHVSFTVTARDADSFRRSEAELTAMLARTVARGKRGL